MVVCCLPEDLSGADLAVRVAVWLGGASGSSSASAVVSRSVVWVPTGSLGRGRLSGRLAELKGFCKEVDF